MRRPQEPPGLKDPRESLDARVFLGTRSLPAPKGIKEFRAPRGLKECKEAPGRRDPRELKETEGLVPQALKDCKEPPERQEIREILERQEPVETLDRQGLRGRRAALDWRGPRRLRIR